MTFSADDAYWKLADIRKLVRRLTGRPSEFQLDNQELDTYINRFLTQEMMQVIDLDQLRGYWKFTTMVNVPLYSIPYWVYAIDGGISVNGTDMIRYSDADSFMAMNSNQYQTRENIGTGDGSTTTFTGTLSKTTILPESIVIDDDQESFIVQDRVLIDGITNASPASVSTKTVHGLTTGNRVRLSQLNGGMAKLNDIETTVTVVDTTNFTLDGVDTTNTTIYPQYINGGLVLPVSIAILEGSQGGSGSVTLSSGAFSVTFNAAPADGQDLRCSYEFSAVARPDSVLIYNNELRFNHTPDGTYHVKAQVIERPKALVQDTDRLVNNDWGNLVGYGAAVNILNDFNQQDEAELLMPRFRTYKLQAQKRSQYERHDMRPVPTF